MEQERVNIILSVLQTVAHALNEQHINWSVGASLLLYFHNLTTVYHDIDIMTTVEDAEKVKDILEKLGAVKEDTKSSSTYRTQYFYEFNLEGAEIDVMAGMVIVDHGTAYDCSMKTDQIEGSAVLNGEKIPLYSLSEWRRFYALMGRKNKVEMIDNQKSEKMF